MNKKAFLFMSLGVAVGAVVSFLVQKLEKFEFELAEFPADEEDEDILVATSATD